MPTKGSTEQKTAILGGHVDVAFMNLSQMLSNHRDGKATIIAIATEERSAIEDQFLQQRTGFDLYMTATRGMVVQADTDPEIQKALDELMVKVLADEEFKAAMEKQLIALAPMDSKEYTEYLTNLQAQTQEVYNANPW